MARNKQSFQKNKNAKWKALNHLISKGYITEVEDIAEVKSQSGVSDLLYKYKKRNPNIMAGKGSAFDRIVSYINRKGGKGSLRGVKALINELELAGKLQSGRRQQRRGKAQKNKMLSAAQALVGKPSFAQAAAFADMIGVEGGMQYSGPAFEFNAKPFLVNSTGQIDWNDITGLLENINKASSSSGISGPQLWGPARLALRKLASVIQQETQSLTGRLRYYNQDTLTPEMNTLAEQYKRHVAAFVEGCISAFNATQKTQLGGIARSYNYTVDKNTEIKVGDKNQFTLGELVSSSVSTKAELIEFLASVATLFSKDSSFGGNSMIFQVLRSQMAQRQDAWAGSLFAEASNGTLAPTAQLGNRLVSAAQNIDALRTAGQIDTTEYKKLETKGLSLVNEAKSIVLPANIGFGGRGASRELAGIKYQFAIVGRKITMFNQEIVEAGAIDAVLKNKEIAGKTRRHFLLSLQSDYDIVKDNSKASTTEEAAAFGSVTLQAAEKSIAAMTSVTILSQTIAQLKQSHGDKQARLIMARLFLNTNYSAGWSDAVKLAGFVGLKTFRKEAQSQMLAYQECYKPDHMKRQILTTFAVDPGQMYKTPPLEGVSGILDAANKFFTVKKDGLQAKIGFIGIEVPSTEDPRLVLSGLPDAVRRLTKQHAKARALAAGQYLKALMEKYQIVKGQAKFGAGGVIGGGDQTNIYKNHLARFKKMLASASYDSTLRNSQVSGSGGLHYCGFISGLLNTASSGVEVRSNAYSKVPYAIIAAYDLMAEPVFRGETVYPPNAAGQFQSQAMTARSAHAGKLLTSQTWTQQGGTSSTGSYLTSRHFVDDFGDDQFYNWHAGDAADLRARYFISLYPFKLAGEFKKLFDANMAKLRGDKQIVPQQVAGGLAGIAAAFKLQST